MLRETLVCIRKTATRHKRGSETEVTVTSKLQDCKTVLMIKSRNFRAILIEILLINFKF